MTAEADPHTASLFKPWSIPKLSLANRLVMAPMTRAFSPGGVPGPDVTEYYRRRAAGGVGLLITEGTWIDHPAAANEPNVPRFYGEDALAGWRAVVDAVHAEGGKIAPQLWHVGLSEKAEIAGIYEKAWDEYAGMVSPSGYIKPGVKVGEPMTSTDIQAHVASYARGAASAKATGFDAVEIHAAHGYLIDQFFWHETNHRTDGWGGTTLAERGRFAIEIVRACRAAVGPDFPILLRFSQWKMQDFQGRLAETPAELATLLEPLSEAGVDIFHASQRRFQEQVFAGSDLNLAGWAKKLTGKPSITVGSVGLNKEMQETLFTNEPAQTASFAQLLEMLDRDEFDLVAVGRSLLGDAQWAEKVRRSAFGELKPFSATALTTLE